MKTQIATKAAFFGAGAGLVIFFLVGLMPASLMGGEAGMAFAEAIFKLPQDPGFMARAIVFLTITSTVLISGIAIVGASSALAWVLGSFIDSGRQKRQDKVA